MAQLGEASAAPGPWEGLVLQGSVFLSGAQPPSLSSSHNPLFSDTPASETAISWLPGVSPAPLGPSGCGVSPSEVGFAAAVGSRLAQVVGEHPGEWQGWGQLCPHTPESHTCLCTLCFSSTLVPIRHLILPLGTNHSPLVSSAWLFLWGRVCHSLLSWALYKPWICFPNHVPI